VSRSDGTEGEEVRVDLVGADATVLRDRDGELLRTVEYLLRRMVRELPPGGLVADSDGQRAAREAQLRRQARAAAEEVRRTGEAFLFEPLPAIERRVVHLAIHDEAGVSSASEGDGEWRRVRVIRALAD
jgi:spoIIIJ-associated protein